MNSLKFFYITNSSEAAAQELADHLLNKRLVGCVNIFPITSSYWDAESIENSNEYVLIGKTIPEKASEVEQEVMAVHPYEVPCIVQFDAICNKGYYEWICSEVGKK